MSDNISEKQQEAKSNEHALITRGQRRVNIIWEGTQAAIAVMITGAMIFCTIYKIPSAELNYAFFLIVAMYFVRTNHQKVGGIGSTEGTR